MINAVAGDKLSQIVHYPFRAVGIEAALVKNHVRAVVAGVRTTQAAGVTELAASGSRGVSIEVAQVIGRCRQIVDVGHWPFRLVMAAVAILE